MSLPDSVETDSHVIAESDEFASPPPSPLARTLAMESALALLAAVISMVVFMWRMEWRNQDWTLPPLYFADPLQSGNLVLNAQQGSPFRSLTLGAPSGQQLGLSAYGIEWPQSVLAASLATLEQGPWLALNRYMLLSFGLLAACGYLGARWAGAHRLPALLAGLMFSLAPLHLLLSLQWFTLGNYASVALVSGLAVRLATGSGAADLVPRLPDSWSIHRRRGCGALAVLLTLAVSVTGGNYYMWFNAMVLALLGALLLTRRIYWRRAMRLWTVAAAQLVTIVALALPIFIARHQAGLSLSEPSTTDRRAFAALANGGELLSAVLPSAGSVSHQLVERVPSFDRFLDEYYSSPFVIADDYQGGLAVLLALLVVAAWWLGLLRRGDLLRRPSPMPPALMAALLVFVCSGALFLRGGVGTLVAFAFPTLRAYDRFVVTLTFAALVIVAIAAGSRQSVRRPIRIGLVLAMMLILADMISGLHPPGPVDRAASTVRDVGGGVEFRSLGPDATKRLVNAASSLLDPGCSVVVFPVTTYPVDFTIGVTSYVAYDTLKPGLENSQLKWTPGWIPGTPNAQWNDELLRRYRSGAHGSAIRLAQKNGACAGLLFSPLQDAIATATAGSGIRHDSADTVRSALQREYGQPCYVDPEGAAELYCGVRS